MGVLGCQGRGEMSVKIKIDDSPAEMVPVHIDRPIWREFLQY